jgi:predicted unusual protein kinase regulating ubiquinone biosynthesis (AarF/ABC1/UbiB family)
MDRILNETIRRNIEENWKVFLTASETPNPTMLIARLSDQVRSNSFLWMEAGLKVQERYSRISPVTMGLSRTIVLAMVATDISVGYLCLRERERWLPNLVGPKDWELQHQRSANRVLDTATSLGGALIKACQFASTRPDLLPAVYIQTLSKLQDRLPPHAWPTIEKVITRELGRRPQEVFDEIEPEPIAAASIAQVHRVRLRDGREVALKVQYPEIANLVATDMTVMERAIAVIASIAPAIQLQPILDYLKGTLPLELDFRHEAAAMAELRTALQHRAEALVPTVIEELSTGHLLVMEFVDGIKITDREALEKAGISPHEVAKLLNDLYAEQMLRLGILHADPHPGNLLVQPGPRLVLLDHGLTVRLPSSLVHSLTEMVRTLVAGDFDGLTRALAEAGLQLDEHVDITTLLQLVGVLLGEERVGTAVEMAPQLAKSLSHVPVNLLMVGRALGMLDGITKQLDPDLNTLEIIARYVQSP